MSNIIFKAGKDNLNGYVEVVFRTTSENESITLPTNGMNNFGVDWGDGSEFEIITTPNPTHNYFMPGDYTIKIDGMLDSWNFNVVSDSATKLIKVNRFDTTKIGLTTLDNAFFGCTNLNTVVGDEFKTQYVTTFSGLFDHCSSLTSLDGSTWNTSKVISMANTFKDTGLTSLTLTNWDTSLVEDMSGMFRNINGLTSIDISNWNMSRNTNMAHMFHSCDALTSINLSGIITSTQLTNLGYMVYYCRKLDTLDVSNLNTTNVTTIEYMFAECNDLTSITGLSNWDTGNVETMRQLFYRCYDLTGISGMTNWDTSKVETFFATFDGIATVPSLDLSNWDTSSCTNMYAMFYGGAELTTTGDLSGWDVSNVTDMESMFKNSPKITDDSIDAWWDGSNPQITAHTDTFTTNTLRPDYSCIPLSWGGGGEPICDPYGTLILETSVSNYDVTLPIYNADVYIDWGDGSSLEHVVNTTVPPTHTYVSTGDHTVKLKGQIDTWSYQDLADTIYGSFRLKEIVSFNADDLGITDMHGAFLNCQNVTLNSSDIYIGPNIQDLSYFFDDCFEITELDITTWGLYRPTSFKHFCYGCSKLTDFTPLGDLTEYVTSMAYMFDGCSSLVEIDTWGWRKTSLTDSSYMFNECGNLETVHLFGWVSNNIDVKYMFNQCDKITDEAIHWWENVNYYSYNNCFTNNTSRPNYTDIPYDWK